MVGKNYGVFRRRPDYLRHIHRSKPITIIAPPVVPVLRSAISGNRAVFRRAHDYWLSFRLARRVKPITITGVPMLPVLRLTSAVFRNRAVYRREYDYWLRYTRRMMPITITAQLAAVTIDGVSSIQLTMQYENVMIGSDNENSKWDIL